MRGTAGAESDKRSAPKSLPAAVLEPGRAVAGENLDRGGHEVSRAHRRSTHHAVAKGATIRLIAEFLQEVRHSARPTILAATAKAALERARVDVAQDPWQRWSSPCLRIDGIRCVVELEGLVARQSQGALVTRAELLHAMDALIGLLVEIDASHRLAVHASS